MIQCAAEVFYMTIAEKIKAARLQGGLTQKQLGELCGYSTVSAERTVQRWEAGDRYVPHEKLRTVAKLLNLTLDDLVP
jgi:transcriptional regulator with XRE-family HTH domain